MNNRVIPGILEKTWEEIEHKIELTQRFTNTLHIDIIDGKFVNNRTFLDPIPFRKFSSKMFLEVHMMVIDPIKLVEPFAHAGFRRFLGHIEHMSSQSDFIAEAKKYGEAGLALDGPTHIKAVKVPFESFDCLLIYTANKVGFSGAPLMDDRLDKIRHLKKLTNVPIEVDGGINEKTIERAKAAGASRFIATSNIWSKHDPADQYRKLESLI